jgi:hypothetical protein
MKPELWTQEEWEADCIRRKYEMTAQYTCVDICDHICDVIDV